MKQEYNNERLGMQMVQQNVIELSKKEELLPAYMKITDEGFLQYEESSCLPTPNGENIGLRRIGTNLGGSVGQVTEMKYSVDDMIQLAREIDSGPYADGSGSEWLYQKVWAHVKSVLPIECKEDYVKSMVRSAIVMYTDSDECSVRGMFIQSSLKNENGPRSRIHNYKTVIFSEGEGKITVDDSHEDNYDRAMKFIV